MLSVPDRYKFKPFIGSSHSWALKQFERIPNDAAVLDVGPGSGAIGQALAERGFKELYAVEIDPDTRIKLAPQYKRIEETAQAFSETSFGLILLLDVLEHMAEPAKFLEQVTQLLAPSGTILVSLPNIAHWSVRFQLLFGKLDYQERGILDRTHLQFFTRKRARQVLGSSPGLRIESESSSIAPAEFVLPNWLYDNEPFRALSRLRLKVAETLPGMFAYQHLMVLRRR